MKVKLKAESYFRRAHRARPRGMSHANSLRVAKGGACPPLLNSYDLKIGLGHDIHGFAPNRDFILGGVKIPFEKGLLGHSDADALTHAIIDALLGAAGLSDIGELFPDTDVKLKGISSAILLTQVVEKIRSLGYIIGNVDSIIHCERPRLGPQKEKMRENLAKVMGISVDRVGVKAGTNEGFDAVGRGEAVSCQVVVLLFRN